MSRLVAVAAFCLSFTAASAHPAAHSGHQAVSLPPVARAAAATVDSFHAALKRGDTAAALALMTDDALIFESGEVERSKSEYAASHVKADAEFEGAVSSKQVGRTGGANGMVAWIATEGRTTGTFRGRELDRLTTETMLLKKVGPAWRITHVHWSSAAAPPKGPAMSTPVLKSSRPANGEVVRAPLNAMEMDFSPPARLLEVIVSGPGGQMPMMVTATGENAHYSLPLSGLGAGAYTVDWRASVGERQEKGTFAFSIR